MNHFVMELYDRDVRYTKMSLLRSLVIRHNNCKNRVNMKQTVTGHKDSLLEFCDLI